MLKTEKTNKRLKLHGDRFVNNIDLIVQMRKENNYFYINGYYQIKWGDRINTANYRLGNKVK